MRFSRNAPERQLRAWHRRNAALHQDMPLLRKYGLDDFVEITYPLRGNEASDS
jgi:hypothetical protein